MEENLNREEIDKIEIQIWELVRLEFDIEQDIIKLQRDIISVKRQKELLETQLCLVKDRQLGKSSE